MKKVVLFISVFLGLVIPLYNSSSAMANSLGICDGLDGAECAAVIFHSDRKQHLAACEEMWEKSTAMDCLKQMKECLPHTVQEMKKFKSYEEIYEEIDFCFFY